MKNLRLDYLIIGLVSVLTSCERYLHIDPPINKLETYAVFSDSASASSAITGIYADMLFSNTGFIASQVRWAGLYADELIYSASSQPILQFSNNSLEIDNSNNNILWRSIYHHIYQVNNVIEKTEASRGISESAKAILVGEARFIRAFLFFYAVNNWGDVPLTLSTDYRINESLSRTPTENVYQQIIDDLEFSIETLPSNYLNDERTRPNSFTAIALLARVYLYNGEWEKSVNEANKVINSNLYLPLPPPDQAFLKGSSETIFQFFAATNVRFGDNSYDGYYFVPSSLTNQTIPTYIIQPALFANFETGDTRSNKWIGVKVISGNPYHFPYKYKVKMGRPATEYTIVLRLSEQFLIRAEAYSRLNRNQEAINDLNTIRSKAGLESISLDNNMDQSQVLILIEKERQRELFCEWGHRWFDLKRTGRANAVLTSLKGNNWQPSDMLWPIPLQQLLTNPNLKQNEGY